MLAAQTSLAIAGTESLTDDRRKLLIAGSADTVKQLRDDAGDLWKPLPSCFESKLDPRQRIVGSFDGVPVCEMDNAPAGLGFFLGGDHVGGVVIGSALGRPHSYHNKDGAMIVHPLAHLDGFNVYQADQIENAFAREFVGGLLTAMTRLAADTLRNQPLCIVALMHKLTGEQLAALHCEAALDYSAGVMHQAVSAPGSDEHTQALEVQRVAFAMLAETEIALQSAAVQKP